MSLLFITLLFLIAGSLQTLLPAAKVFGPLSMPLLLSLLIYTALHASRDRAVFAALLAGVLHDALSPAPFGISIPFFLIAVVGILLLREEIFADQLVTYVLLGAAGLLLKTLYFTLVFTLGGVRPFDLGALGMRLVGSLLCGALVAPVVYIIVAHLKLFWRRKA